MLNIEMLIVITDRGGSERYVSLFQRHGLHLALAVLGRGTATPEVLSGLNLEESEKVVFFSFGNSDKVRATIKDINREFLIRRPGTGIVLTIPLSSIGGEAAAHYLSEEPVERKDYTMKPEEGFELIVVITNEGYNGMVIEAAREKGGATGGTVIHARGLGSEQAQKFFGISLSDEKEIVIIACRKQCRDRIMQAIIDHAGQSTKARSIVFSLPISSVAGLWILQEESEIQ